MNLADLLLLAGRSDEAIEVARRGLEELSGPDSTGSGYSSRKSSSTGAIGRPLASAMPSPDRRQVGSTLLFRRMCLVEHHLGRGDDEAARQELDAAARAARDSTEPQFVGPLAALRAEMERRAGDLGAARVAVDEALDRIEYARTASPASWTS